MKINRFTVLWGLLLGSTNYLCFMVLLLFLLFANVIDVKRLPFLIISTFLITFAFIICSFFNIENAFLYQKFAIYSILFLFLLSLRLHRVFGNMELVQVIVIAIIFGVGTSVAVGMPVLKVAPNFDVFRSQDRFSAVHTSFNTLSVVLLVLWLVSKKKFNSLHVMAHWTVFSRTVLGLMFLAKIVEILLKSKFIIALCITIGTYFLVTTNLRAVIDDFVHLGTLYERFTGIERALPILADNLVWGLGEGKFDALGYHETSIHNHVIRAWLEGGIILVGLLLVFHVVILRIRMNFVAKLVLSVAPFFTPFVMPLHFLLAVSLSRINHSSKEL